MLYVTPTLHFNGQCEEAIKLYQAAFSARVTCLLLYSDRDKRDWDILLTEAQEHYVYHSELMIGTQRVMMADNHEQDLQRNTSIFLTVTFECMGGIKQAYEMLRDDGTVIVPIHSATYSSCMVSLVDRFDVRWGLMTEDR